jgi:RluA family pseudouridine synthase
VRIGWLPRHEPRLDLVLRVLARGPGWLACDKPAGLPVHPAGRVRDNSVIRLLRRQEALESLALVHRLDRETTGVLLVAAEPRTARLLSLAFARGEVGKEYLAVVAGDVVEPAGRIDLPIGDDETSRALARRRAGCGQPARTDWRVERRFGDRTLLRVFPHTGRRHQIRVHLAAIGHPVLGDPLYGRSDEEWLALVLHARDPRRERPGPRRQLLHCARLVFPDPAASSSAARFVVVDAPPPSDIVPGA